MPDILKSIDQGLFFFLNGLHSPFFDLVMFYGTMTVLWSPLYLVLLCLVIRKYRLRSLWVLLFAVIMIIVSDQLSGIVKEWVARPRPTHEPALSGIHTVNGYLGGQFGFYSAHASTNMAIALFMIIILGRPFRYFPEMIIAWALFMAYTRIYLGVHYPGDIMAGWFAGAFIGWCAGSLCIRFLIPGRKKSPE